MHSSPEQWESSTRNTSGSGRTAKVHNEGLHNTMSRAYSKCKRRKKFMHNSNGKTLEIIRRT
jgi:hypothetical protein